MKIRFAALAALLILAAGILRAEEDARPVVDASKVAVEKIRNAALPTFHIVGDSTVRIGGAGAGLWGWGERIAPFFDTNKINVVNHAIGGRSARTFFTEGRWAKVMAGTKPGDFVIIQFGHNDDAQAHGATVIICAPIPHKQRWEHGRDFANVAEWDQEVAQAHGALCFDLTMVITDAYKKIGSAKVETFFADKGTHTSDSGAQFNAACVIAGLKSLPGDPLEKFLSEKGKAVEHYQPSTQTNPTSAKP